MVFAKTFFVFSMLSLSHPFSPYKNAQNYFQYFQKHLHTLTLSTKKIFRKVEKVKNICHIWTTSFDMKWKKRKYLVSPGDAECWGFPSTTANKQKNGVEFSSWGSTPSFVKYSAEIDRIYHVKTVRTRSIRQRHGCPNWHTIQTWEIWEAQLRWLNSQNPLPGRPQKVVPGGALLPPKSESRSGGMESRKKSPHPSASPEKRKKNVSGKKKNGKML